MPILLPPTPLAPYSRWLLERSAVYANWLLADQVEPGHLLGVLMQVEECAAYQATLRCFADPETIAEESRALCSGIMVTGSNASLPFSPLGLATLRRARLLARDHAAPAVEPAHLLHAACSELPAELVAAFTHAGFDAVRLAGAFGPAASTAQRAALPAAWERESALFAVFSEAAKRTLSLAARGAREAREPNISSAHILTASLAREPGLAAQSGVTLSRARALLREKTHDHSPLPDHALPADDELSSLVSRWQAGTSSMAMLGDLHGAATSDIAKLLIRQRVTQSALERLAKELEDPKDPPQDPELAHKLPGAQT